MPEWEPVWVAVSPHASAGTRRQNVATPNIAPARVAGKRLSGACGLSAVAGESFRGSPVPTSGRPPPTVLAGPGKAALWCPAAAEERADKHAQPFQAPRAVRG